MAKKKSPVGRRRRGETHRDPLSHACNIHRGGNRKIEYFINNKAVLGEAECFQHATIPRSCDRRARYKPIDSARSQAPPSLAAQWTGI